MQPPDNPYAPPRSQVLDLPESVPERCNHVEWACKLMWIGLGLSTLELLLTISLSLESAGLATELIGGLLGLGFAFTIVFWFTVKLRAGRNWMRWLVTILTALGVVAFAFAAALIPRPLLVEIFAAGPLQMANTGIQMILSVAEVVLINTPAAHRWFQARSSG